MDLLKMVLGNEKKDGSYLYLEEVFWRTIDLFKGLLPRLWHCLHGYCIEILVFRTDPVKYRTRFVANMNFEDYNGCFEELDIAVGRSSKLVL